MKNTNLLLADDHEMILEGLIAMLQLESNLNVVATAKSGNEVLSLMRKGCKVDFAILDINMPGKDGIEVTKIIKRKYPSVKVLILSMYNQREFVRKLSESGADGYILKNGGKSELLRAISAMQKGEKFFCKEVLQNGFVVNPHGRQADHSLSKREKEIAVLIAKGYSGAEIVSELHISQHTVNSHRKSILSKIEGKNSVDIARYALKTGIVKAFDLR